MHQRIVVSLLTDPYVNLAIENALLTAIHQPALFLYQNHPCVVIGRAQNPWIETDVEFLMQNQIPLVRRQSGGGTVVHDQGNLNFSFLSPKASFDKNKHMEMIQNALAELRIATQTGERCDLMINNKKISGSAFRETRENCFHHGTLLVHSDLTFLKRCLQVPSHKITSKSIPSRRSAVMNLTDLMPSLTIDKVKTSLIKHFQNRHRLNTTEIITLTEIPEALKISETQTLYSSDEWIYQRTLPFSEEIIISGKPVKLEVESGVVTKIEPLYPELMPFLNCDYYLYRKLRSGLCS